MSGTRSKQIRWYAATEGYERNPTGLARKLRKSYNRMSLPERMAMIDQMGTKPKPPKQ